MVYTGLGVAHLVLVAVQYLYAYLGQLRAACSIHDLFLSRMLHAQPRFFDRTPAGRILARFGKDIERH